MPRTPLSLLVLLLSAPCARSEDKDVALAAYDARIKAADRAHWAYQPVRRPEVPAVKNQSWLRNPIDAFILAPLDKLGWQPAAPATPRAWLRRVHLDLTGLPPTIAEQESFLQNPRHEQVIDQLLARSTYGERWARHWLDVARYAETNGYERDAAKPYVWRYRDYVIRAFNDDKPYDRFILEQLAGDELAESGAEALIATGFLRLGPWDDEPADPKEDRFDQLEDLVSTTALSFLGLTLACARCHDHKFEALTMHDYYRMVAVFNPLRRPQKGRTEIDLPLGTRAQIAADKDAKLPRGYFLHEPTPQPPATHLLVRGKATRPGPEVVPGVPGVLVGKQPAFLPPDQYTSRRRLTLAQWIADAKNPLSARVWVNRVWHFHFGAGLVRTPSDFGVMGSAPTHPELLDWLADWFVANGWSTKKLHRLILTSNTYRMSKTWNKEYAGQDPENEHLWRFPYRRLEVEAIRDSALAVAGNLNPKMYGPWMYPDVPKEALAGSSDPDKIWKAFDAKEAARRTIYAHIKRSFVVPFLEVLDLCDTTRSTDQRLVTTVAPQALTLFNGAFVKRQSQHLAARLEREVGHAAGRQIERVFLLALCRPPTASELQRLTQFLEREATAWQSEGSDRTEMAARRHALEQVCRVIFNINEFVYLD